MWRLTTTMRVPHECSAGVRRSDDRPSAQLHDFAQARRQCGTLGGPEALLLGGGAPMHWNHSPASTAAEKGTDGAWDAAHTPWSTRHWHAHPPTSL